VLGGPDAARETGRERRSIAAPAEKLANRGCCAGFHAFRPLPSVSPFFCIGSFENGSTVSLNLLQIGGNWVLKQNV
jgi:hypothetical protein